MKNFIKVLSIFTLFAFSIIDAQVTDTLAYAKSFETNKANYIGQPFSKLLNDMTLTQPKSIWSFGYYSSLNFCNMDNSTDIGTVNLVIYWQTVIPWSEIEYYENKNHFYFTNDEGIFYGSKIVKNISIIVD